MPNKLIRHLILSSIIDKSSTMRSSQIGIYLVKGAPRSFIIDYFLSNVTIQDSTSISTSTSTSISNSGKFQILFKYTFVVSECISLKKLL